MSDVAELEGLRVGLDVAPPPRPRGWLSPQVLLGIGGLLTFVLAGVSINTLWGGLPAHPLFMHVPVVLIPVVALGTLVIVYRQRWFERHSLWLCATAVVALGSLNLTMNAGDALRADLGLDVGYGPVASLVARHAHAASLLRVCMIAFTAALIVAVAIDRHLRHRRTGIAWIDALVGFALAIVRDQRVVRVALALLALGCLYLVFLTGDLGARAVWAGKLAAGSPGP